MPRIVGSQTSPPDITFMNENIVSTYTANAHPIRVPKKVPRIPVIAPHRKKILSTDFSERPIVRKIAISRLLFFTSIISPEFIFIVAIKTKIDMITNITLSSISKARR